MPVKLRPMSEFDPTREAFVHDKVNDRVLRWEPEWAAHYQEHAITKHTGRVGWDGLILDGWQPGCRCAA
jgi:hypothetical protein